MLQTKDACSALRPALTHYTRQDGRRWQSSHCKVVHFAQVTSDVDKGPHETAHVIGALAAPSDILVSSTVKDLVAGSGPSSEDAGEHELKGVPTAGSSTGWKADAAVA
jgi:hypothetical protein